MTNLEIAQANHKAHTKADIARMFHNGPAFDAFALFGFRNGWYHVGSEAFDIEQITGRKGQCPIQAAFAYL